MLTAVSSSSPSKRPAVERLDVDQLVRELVVARVDLVVRQGVEHERVVGVGAVADADQLLGCVAVTMSSSCGGLSYAHDSITASRGRRSSVAARARRSRLLSDATSRWQRRGSRPAERECRRASRRSRSAACECGGGAGCDAAVCRTPAARFRAGIPAACSTASSGAASRFSLAARQRRKTKAYSASRRFDRLGRAAATPRTSSSTISMRARQQAVALGRCVAVVPELLAPAGRSAARRRSASAAARAARR